MPLPFTKKNLVDWAGDQVLRDAQTLVERGHVLEADFKEPLIKGSILWNNRKFDTALEILPDGNVESKCPCYMNRERGLICAHVIALAVNLIERATDPMRDAKHQEEMRRAQRLESVDESAYIKRADAGTRGAVNAKIRVVLDSEWLEGYAADGVPVLCYAVYDKKKVPLDEVPEDLPLVLSKRDEALLFVLEDISEGPAKGRLVLNPFDFGNLIGLHKGRKLKCADGGKIVVNEPKLTTFIRMDLDRENGELIIIAHTEVPYMKPGEFPTYLVSGKSGWLFGAGNLWPLENVLPAPYHSIYKEPVIIARPDVLSFIRRELPALAEHARIESDITPDLFTVEPGTPAFRLFVKGSPASLSSTIYARYDDIELVACKPDAKEHFGIPDPDDLLRYTVRNPDAEKAALIRLRPSGFSGECGDDLSSIVGGREVLNFLGSWLPALRRKGWQVELKGKVSGHMDSLTFATPVVHISEGGTGNWFDVGFDFEDMHGASVSAADIQLAIRKGDSFVKSGDRTILIDSDAIQSMQGIFSDCASGEGAGAGQFRMSSVYAPFVKSSLDALDGIDVEMSPEWRDSAGRCNRIERLEPVPLGEPLDGILRGYQKEGVSWLRFLEGNGFCGILADEMGLGKTIQALAWLDNGRSKAEGPVPPALVICPTSLVENWEEEAAKFTPHRKVLTLTGPDRHERWKDVETSDIVVTSYALLRRDLELYLEHEFSVVVLDEAQHIKNRSTQNAVSAKSLSAQHRLVLTGTPIENSVSDLWSIMDFLMPGYLGRHDAFRQDYELPIAHGGPDAEIAQTKLRRKLHPFLLRRLKTQVAADLPPKIERISACPLTPDQRMVYQELLKSSRQKISDMVKKRGFNKCRMEILTLLLRLRQVCCHLGLLDLPELKPKRPSGKMQLFFELLDEAMDGGHRVLVFSQFVSMLTILREELAARELQYCYLDGSTKDRLSVVKQFNTQRDIPMFLISLKAGGTGLNLTGADMVIHFDPWWNPAVEDQATDRAHRIGQTRTVYSVKLITRDTVEEKVLALQKKKKAIIDATIESDEKAMQTMTWDDIQEILSM